MEKNMLVLASNNRGKLREIQQMLADTNISAVSQAEAGFDLEVDETGQNFAENAELKARAIRAAAEKQGIRCYVLADDSGLAVDALNGEPGVYSHRWAGENATDDDRINKLLEALREVPETERGAHFACAMCLITPDGDVLHFEGRVVGRILFAPQGSNGFGYDPVFGYGDRSFAELSAEEKNAVSHRHNALKQVLRYLQEQEI